MFAGVAASLQSLLAQPALLAMGAGLLAGAVTGTVLVATGTLPDQPDPELNLLSCYRSGQTIARVKSGAAMLVTARSADGAWLELYIGVPGADRGWAPTSALRITTPIDSLPLGDCIGQIALGTVGPPATPRPSTQPTPGPTIVATLPPTFAVPTFTVSPLTTPTVGPRPTPSPKPTVKPSVGPTVTALPPPPPPPTNPPTPTPVPTPDVFAPSVSAPSIYSPPAYVNGSYYLNANFHCGQPSAIVHVNASDPSGLSYVRLYYRPPGGSTTFGSMTNVGGGTYSFTITPNNTWLDGEIGLWAQAQDTHGNTSGFIPFGNPNSTSDVSLFWSAICLT
jgi:hypothetical protein